MFFLLFFFFFKFSWWFFSSPINHSGTISLLRRFSLCFWLWSTLCAENLGGYMIHPGQEIKLLKEFKEERKKKASVTCKLDLRNWNGKDPVKTWENSMSTLHSVLTNLRDAFQDPFWMTLDVLAVRAPHLSESSFTSQSPVLVTFQLGGYYHP